MQFLRAFAALFVVFYHTAQHYFAVGGEHSWNFFSFMSKIGYLGVDIFFVISGYIMWYTTHNTQGLKGVLEFVYARLTRIYPLYWSFFLLLILIYWGKDDKIVPIDNAEQINRYVKNSKMRIYDGDHFFFLGNAKQICEDFKKDK
ncbi:MAG: acyltransferase family protein [Campylobacteraceae bacterium]|nr:acyltransferase family protein [Campylobacteraceae bacterium]